MIDRSRILEVLRGYDLDDLRIGMIASHSALDTADGAVEENFRTLAVCQDGREKPYVKYFRASRDRSGKIVGGMIDEVMMLKRFSEIIEPENQNILKNKNALFVPNRSFTSYCGIDAVEDQFCVPLLGSRNLLRSEERGDKRDYYWILEKAGLPFPEPVEAEDIKELVMVKLPHAVKTLERGFFTASSYEEYCQKAETLLRQNVIDQDGIELARIERYIIGPVFNLDFFYSPISKQIELIGIDWRFETSLDGHCRLPAPQQLTLNDRQINPEYTVCGHNSATLRESLLEKAFELAEKYVAATQEHYSPGIIGPFCLQTCVDKDLNFYIYDVAPRIGGGTNVHMAVGHPYGNALWRTNMSTGRRLAREVRIALEKGCLEKIIT
ncbi:MAG: formate--phosphoribosylaminoimidazolecarboxamide ligase family protein [Methanothrix sp.]|nr:formate--phosphoribosylaminoimidazolecarboxamide ligase family protein [Methanothrix sp.]MDD1731165.1 formate--phosphoribosylaminoimidazolecarboxamide ligase family protein [Methanothrix sp.]MDD1739050.1 formate--phosphoribosylaminoimidazolecarboxamide ligase family protein [Methanothrix sp.]OYV11195.1 MAG: 5-formaminoimidazole-4-carboxamide-1-(beta)-D-ribofuranosyl 5'-monophosphate synthetase [Methanosaeta sp. ASM2]OYV14898.1 MAG: 5-formaminoimidazole-4-carboxamide-1-(beta)-D-ribofuranosyl 